MYKKLVFVVFLLNILFTPASAKAQDSILAEYKTGEVFSFNSVVGPRFERAGFKKAKVIFKKRLRKDYGGGVCQVASTLHAVFLHAGFEIVEAHPHSRVSAYIQPSLDSTVIWGSKDLKVRNPYKFPVRIIADVTKPGSIYITAHGNGKVPTVILMFEVKETQPFDTWKVARADWKVGKRKVQEPGTLGYKLYRVRLLQSPDGTIQEERLYFNYPPSKRIIVVGTGI
jgi:hypothetical protein